jgi:hypothetical protein
MFDIRVVSGLQDAFAESAHRGAAGSGWLKRTRCCLSFSEMLPSFVKVCTVATASVDSRIGILGVERLLRVRAGIEYTRLQHGGVLVLGHHRFPLAVILALYTA